MIGLVIPLLLVISLRSMAVLVGRARDVRRSFVRALGVFLRLRNLRSGSIFVSL